MTKADKSDPKSGKSGSRAGRLAAALRENLRRRKAQARGRTGEPAQPSGDAAPAAKGGKLG